MASTILSTFVAFAALAIGTLADDPIPAIGQEVTGFATYYNTYDSYGSCGNIEHDSDLVAAISPNYGHVSLSDCVYVESLYLHLLRMSPVGVTSRSRLPGLVLQWWSKLSTPALHARQMILILTCLQQQRDNSTQTILTTGTLTLHGHS